MDEFIVRDSRPPFSAFGPLIGPHWLLGDRALLAGTDPEIRGGATLKKADPKIRGGHHIK